MKADFDLENTNDIAIELTPATAEERLLLAAWLRFDQNCINAEVTRGDVDEITCIRLTSCKS